MKTLLNYQIKEFVQIANQLLEKELTPSFSVALLENIETMQQYEDGFQKSLFNLEGYLNYDNERMEICRTLASKDSDGNPIIMNGSFRIEYPDQFALKMNELNQKYASLLEEIDEAKRSVAMINFRKVKVADAPSMKGTDMQLIRLMLED